MIIERVFVVRYLENEKDMSKIEKYWSSKEEPVSPEELQTLTQLHLDVVKELNPDKDVTPLEWDSVFLSLFASKVISDGEFFYRLKSSHPKCPKYGSSYEKGTEALSRMRDIAICSECGVAEALQEHLTKTR